MNADRLERTDLAQTEFDGRMHAGHNIDADGLFADNPGLMRTATGLRVDPLDLQPADVNITDIARSLAAQARYNGHSYGHLSVARHSIWVAEWLQGAGCDTRVQLTGLLHDAAEAYVSDIVRPVKHRPEMQPFRDADARAERVIAYVFDVPYPWPDFVHRADTAIGQLELDVHRDTWGRDVVWIDGEPFTQAVVDEAEFTAAYDQLTKELGR